MLIGYLGCDYPSTIHLIAVEQKQNGFCWYIITNKVIPWAASYAACVVYTKTVIHLSVGESGGYLPPLRWIIVNYLSCFRGRLSLACVADETKPRFSPSANQRPKACSAPRVLPVLSIIGSNWLLHIVVLSCTVIGRVDVVKPWLRSRWIPDTQNKRRRSRNYQERYI